MALALNASLPGTLPTNTEEVSETHLRTKQQRVAESAEMIHIGSLFFYNRIIFCRRFLHVLYTFAGLLF